MKKVEISSARSSIHAIRGAFLGFVDDPLYVSELESVQCIANELRVIVEGAIAAGICANLLLYSIDVPVTAALTSG